MTVNGSRGSAVHRSNPRARAQRSGRVGQEIDLSVELSADGVARTGDMVVRELDPFPDRSEPESRDHHDEDEEHRVLASAGDRSPIKRPDESECERESRDRVREDVVPPHRVIRTAEHTADGDGDRDANRYARGRPSRPQVGRDLALCS